MEQEKKQGIGRYAPVVPAKYGNGLGDKLACVDKVWFKKDSKEWYTRCDCCFKVIDVHTDEECFVSEDFMLILCQNCYTHLKNYH